jgi:hypothetical protein
VLMYCARRIFTAPAPHGISPAARCLMRI